MVNIKKRERTLIINDEYNCTQVQLDFYGHPAVFFNLDHLDHHYSKSLVEDNEVLIEIDRYEQSNLYDSLLPLFETSESYSWVNKHPYKELKDDEAPNAFTISINENYINICLVKSSCEFSDNVYLNETSENIEVLNHLYSLISAYLKSKRLNKTFVGRYKGVKLNNEN